MSDSKLEVGQRVMLTVESIRDATRLGGRLRFVEERVAGKPVLTAEVMMPGGKVGVAVGYEHARPRVFKSVATLVSWAHSAAPDQDEVVIILKRPSREPVDDGSDDPPVD